MDSIFGFVGKDYVIMAADCSVAFSIMKLTNSADKIYPIDDLCLAAAAGEPYHRDRFCSLINKNIQLFKLKQGHKMSSNAIANYAKSQLSYYLRESPFQCDLIIGAMDETPELYYLDYMGTLQKLDHCAHGYGAYFISSVFDNFWKPEMSVEEGLALVKKCITEIQTRFLISQQKFIVKMISTKGVQYKEM